jgi:hypothetical protein
VAAGFGDRERTGVEGDEAQARRSIRPFWDAVSAASMASRPW